jgi:putative DNA primase/helicase
VLAPDRKINSLLAKYVSSLATDAREIVVDKTGWYGDAFVLPERTFGDMSGDRYVLSDLPDNPYAVAGTLAEWQASVGSLCRGNPQLVFAVSAGFSAMLAPFADVASNMGFHFHGHSSMGKSTALYAAGSVWGHRPDSKDGYLNSWRTTNNALEGTALLFNYTLLCMDEIKSNMDLSNIGAMMLMLGNGSNKGRMRVNDTKREPKSWRTTTLSSGESTMVACARAAGGEMQGGEQIRMLDIPTQPFIDLHGRSGPDVFSKAVVAAACTNYGTASRAFLSYLTGPYGYQTKLGYCGLMAGILSRWRREMMGGDDPTTGRVPFPAEVGRAAEHFAAVAAAGEDATQRHITGWPPGEAADAAHTMFKAWLDARGHTGAADANTSQEFVRGLIRQHGASRFQQEESENSFRTVQNSLGHTWMHDGDPVYFFCEGDSFSKECKLAKLDPRKVWKEVNAAGWPVLKSTGRNTYEKRFKDRTKPSGYVVRLPEDRGADADAAAERAERGKAVELERERLSSAAPGTQVRGF